MSHAQERPRRREVLDALRNADAPLGVADVAARLGVHGNTARFHLDALVAEGRAERTVERPSGPGRPRTVYAPHAGMDRGGPRGYRLLARILLGHLASSGPGAEEAAARAGRTWGRFLVDEPLPFQELTAEEAIARLTCLLDDLGFAPEPEGGGPVPEEIRLRRCPFLELAEEYGPLVCRVHLGLMRGALDRLRAPVTVAGLEPFATPDSCAARLERVGAARDRKTFGSGP